MPQRHTFPLWFAKLAVVMGLRCWCQFYLCFGFGYGYTARQPCVAPVRQETFSYLKLAESLQCTEDKKKVPGSK